jgi:hypothetical protein
MPSSGTSQDHRHERGQHDRPPGVQPEVRAHRVERADAARERRRRARQRGVEHQEQQRRDDQRRDPLQLEVLQPVLVRQVAGEGGQQSAGRTPADRVLGDVEHEPLERAAADRLGDRQRERVHDDDGRHAVRQQQREREGGRERHLAVAVGDLDREQLRHEDRDGQQHEQAVRILDHVRRAGEREPCQHRQACDGDGRYERSVRRRGHVVKDLTTSSEPQAPGHAGVGAYPPPHDVSMLTTACTVDRPEGWVLERS